MKIFVYLLIFITSILVILMDILKFFLVFIYILGYFFILGFIFVSLIRGTIIKRDLISFGLSAGVCFSIFYGYFAIFNFLVGFKSGLIESLKK